MSETPVHSGTELQTAGLTGNGVAADVRLARQLVIYITGETGVTAGAVQLETAPTADYAGTWSAEGSPITVVAATTKIVAVTAQRAWVRARITTTVDGGGVGVRLFAT